MQKGAKLNSWHQIRRRRVNCSCSSDYHPHRSLISHLATVKSFMAVFLQNVSIDNTVENGTISMHEAIQNAKAIFLFIEFSINEIVVFFFFWSKSTSNYYYVEYPIPARPRHKNRQVPISRKPRVVSQIRWCQKSEENIWTCFKLQTRQQ